MEKKIKMEFMLPSKDRIKVWFEKDTIRSWDKVSQKAFLEEWRKNGLFEQVTSCYNGGNMVLYIQLTKPK